MLSKILKEKIILLLFLKIVYADPLCAMVNIMCKPLPGLFCGLICSYTCNPSLIFLSCTWECCSECGKSDVQMTLSSYAFPPLTLAISINGNLIKEKINSESLNINRKLEDIKNDIIKVNVASTNYLTKVKQGLETKKIALEKLYRCALDKMKELSIKMNALENKIKIYKLEVESEKSIKNSYNSAFNK